MMPKRPIPPLSGQDELPDYYVCLPVNLRPAAVMFIRHLHELPYQQYRCCPHCDSSSVYFSKGVQPGFRLPTYRCRSCRKGYNSLTGTPFARLEHMHLWSTFAVYLLAGWPGPTAAPLIGISGNAFYRWVRAAREVMAQEFPELHQRWSARQDRQNLQPAEQIEKQRQAVGVRSLTRRDCRRDLDRGCAGPLLRDTRGRRRGCDGSLVGRLWVSPVAHRSYQTGASEVIRTMLRHRAPSCGGTGCGAGCSAPGLRPRCCCCAA